MKTTYLWLRYGATERCDCTVRRFRNESCWGKTNVVASRQPLLYLSGPQGQPSSSFNVEAPTELTRRGRWGKEILPYPSFTKVCNFCRGSATRNASHPRGYPWFVRSAEMLEAVSSLVKPLKRYHGGGFDGCGDGLPSGGDDGARFEVEIPFRTEGDLATSWRGISEPSESETTAEWGTLVKAWSTSPLSALIVISRLLHRSLSSDIDFSS